MNIGPDLESLKVRLRRYAGKSMNDRRKPTNPNFTTREIIVLADYVAELEEDLKTCQNDIENLWAEIDLK